MSSGSSYATRSERHHTVGAALAALSDRELQHLVETAPLGATSVGGRTTVIDIAGTPVFAKRVILTDGERLYLTDFGLAMSRQFTLSEPERRFFAHHARYDACVLATELVNWLRTTYAGALPAFAAAIVERHGQTAYVLNEFYRRLRFESRATPYPAELERASW